MWAILADFGSIVRWAPDVDHSCILSDRPDGVGAVRRVQTGATTVVERVVTWEPELMLAYAIEGLPSAVRYASSCWVLRPVTVGTSVTLISDIDTTDDLRGLVVRLFVRRELARAGRTMIDGLASAAAAVEAGG